MPDIKISDLTAATSASGAQQIEVNDSGTSKRITVDQIKAYVVSAGSIDSTALGTDAVTAVKILNGAVTPAKLSTGGLYWDTSGNVGIGTTSLSQKLTVSGHILANGGGASGAWIYMKDSDSVASGFYIGQNSIEEANIWNSENTPLLFATNNTEHMRIDASGNVGIGTSSPATFSGYKTLTINSATGGIFSTQVNGTNSFRIGADASAAYVHEPRNVPMIFYTNNLERLYLGTAGQLGIGGANYGTSGQVLTSQGSGAAPVWASASGGVTSLNGQTGAITDTNLYAIGSYVIGRPQNTTSYTVNTTLAGSSLYATAAAIRWDNVNGVWSSMGYTSNLSSTVTLVNTGTWRCVSPAVGASTTIMMAGLWVRIS